MRAERGGPILQKQITTSISYNMSQRVVLLVIIFIVTMEADLMSSRVHKINGKTFLVPHYNLEGYQQFLLPKLDFKGTHHVYFNTDDINELYKQHNMDPDNLDCNLKYDPQNALLAQTRKDSKAESNHSNKQLPPKEEEIVKEQSKGKPRPVLRKEGFTHFVHIPLADAVRVTYLNIIKGSIDQNDLDALVPLQTLHVSLLVFRLKSEADLPKWQKILQSLKLRKVRLVLRGVGIFPVKPNTNYTQVFYVKVDGLGDIIHDLVQKAIMEGLLSQQELKKSYISLDKKTDMYRLQQQHLTILKTKGKDIIDAGPYLKSLAKLNITKPTFKDVRLSVIGSFDGQQYYDQCVVPLDR